MSQTKKKKVVVTTQNKTEKGQKTKPKVARRGGKEQASSDELIFGRQNYILMGVGVLLIVLGLALMSGGAMDNPNEWEPERIYSFRRTVLAPFLILAGLVVEIFAIFRR